MSGVQSIERAFALLRALAVGPAGVTELADRADLPKSTVARLLGALETEGAVAQEEAGGEYRLGPGLIDLSGAAMPGRNLVASARPHLLELKEQTGETSGLATLDGSSVLYLDHVETEEEVQVRDWTGERVPPHLVPSGLVLLAGAPQDFVDRYLSRPLAAATSSSVIDPAAIRERLIETSKDGYSWGYAEFDDSINSIAAPVLDKAGRVHAALHLYGPAYRFPGPKQDDEIAALLVETARKLSMQIV